MWRNVLTFFDMFLKFSKMSTHFDESWWHLLEFVQIIMKFDFLCSLKCWWTLMKSFKILTTCCEVWLNVDAIWCNSFRCCEMLMAFLENWGLCMTRCGHLLNLYDILVKFYGVYSFLLEFDDIVCILLKFKEILTAIRFLLAL